MTGTYTHLEVNESEKSGIVHRTVRVTADNQPEAVEVFYDFLTTKPCPIEVLDGFVCSILFYAMQLGNPLRVHGRLSSSAAYNLDDFQRAWALWRPHKYKRIDIIADEIVGLCPKGTKTLQAFSGGVDANFTLLNNNHIRKGKGGYHIEAAVFVQGFDIATQNDDAFHALVDRYRPFLNERGVELHAVKTNSKELAIQDWSDSHTAELAAILHQFDGQFSRALAGSAEPYDHLLFPLGSNPITDHLVSGDLMAFIHDGAGYSRTEKIEALSKHRAFLENLRVCWEGIDNTKNCGSCEKCIRTRLNFSAAGCDAPPCFDKPFTPDLITKIRPRNDVQISELSGIISYLERNDKHPAWKALLEKKIAYLRLYRTLIRLLEKAGLKNLLRKILLRR
jgi:hypothetical protein